MIPLNLPQAALNLSRKNDQIFVFCPIRKKKLVLTPEEWVRQHIISFLVNDIGISIGKIASEYSLKYNNMNRRADLVVMNGESQPSIIVECKRPTVPINQNTLHQAAEYEHVLSAQLLILSNGIEHSVINLKTGETANNLESLPLMM